MIAAISSWLLEFINSHHLRPYCHSSCQTTWWAQAINHDDDEDLRRFAELANAYTIRVWWQLAERRTPLRYVLPIVVLTIVRHPTRVMRPPTTPNQWHRSKCLQQQVLPPSPHQPITPLPTLTPNLRAEHEAARGVLSSRGRISGRGLAGLGSGPMGQATM